MFSTPTKVTAKEIMRRSVSEGRDTSSSDLEQLRPEDSSTELLTDEERSSGSNGSHHLTRWQCCCRCLVFLSLVACVVLVLVDFATTQYIQTTSSGFMAWVGRHPPQGVLAVIVVLTAATILFVPANILTIFTGFAFRNAFGNYNKALGLGSFAVFFGASFGAILSFLLGRYLFRAYVKRLARKYPTFRAIDSALGQNGLKIMFLLRLSPLIPHNSLDYLSGVTALPLWKYSVSLLGMLPGVIMFCAIGAAASSLADGQKWVEENRAARITAICGGLLLTIGAVVVASYYSKVELEKILKEQRQQQSSENVDDDNVVLVAKTPQGLDFEPYAVE